MMHTSLNCMISEMTLPKSKGGLREWRVLDQQHCLQEVTMDVRIYQMTKEQELNFS